jgi:hypothetical protein
VWGVFVRTVYVWHITWCVNSVTHLWGYRNYEVSDHSRNNWIIGLTNNGEGWHNNHHADQHAAAHGHRWWELDVSYLTIRALESVGLAWDVVRPHAWSERQPVGIKSVGEKSVGGVSARLPSALRLRLEESSPKSDADFPKSDSDAKRESQPVESETVGGVSNADSPLPSNSPSPIPPRHAPTPARRLVV